MKILSVVGARPNFMKIAPISDELKKREIPHVLVHTGQHYDHKMSKLFFEELGIPKPDIDLEVGSGSHAQQTAEIMKRIEPVLEKERPSLVLVVGDVNSTMAATLVAAKLGIRVAHVEAGLRSFDRTMPEEINRLVTDSISDYLFTTEESANENLKREGVAAEQIFFVGNTMIDTLLKHVDRAENSDVLERFGLSPRGYGVVTLHRPANVDDPETLGRIVEALNEIARDIPLVFPVHPRTKDKLSRWAGLPVRRLEEEAANQFEGSAVNRLDELNRPTGPPAHRLTGISLVDPLGYLDFLKLMKHSRIVFTDSGGIQEETTVLGVPCITLRENTERPVTISSGTNVIVGTDKENILSAARARLNGSNRLTGQPANRPTEFSVPPFWDGHAAERIVDVIVNGV